MARNMQRLGLSYPSTHDAHKEQAMLALTLFFIAGILLGFIGLRLLNRWEIQADKRPPIFRRHP